jgi:hypothetical protein
MNIITTIPPAEATVAFDAFAQWTEARASSTGYCFCHGLGYGFKSSRTRKVDTSSSLYPWRTDHSGEIRERYRVAPAPPRREPCPAPHLFGHFRIRTAIILLPKWGNSAVRFSKLPPWKHPRYDPARLFSVSDASVVRSRFRADQAATTPPPAEVKSVWQEPTTEPVDYATRFEMMLDEELQDDTRIDDEQADEEMRGLTVAVRRRTYSSEELATTARWDRGLFSQVKYDGGPFLEERVAHHWRYIDRQNITALMESDLSASFSRMFHRATVINAKINRLCDAEPSACRAYQGAAVTRDCYLYGLRVSTTEMLSAAIVIEAIGEHLRRAGRIDWQSRTAVLDMLEGTSSYATAEKFGLDPSSLRERYDTETASIEAKFGHYCCREWEPPQKRPTLWYNKNEIAAPKPWLAERQLTPSKRKAFVLQYIELASGPIFKPTAGDAEITWFRLAYKLIAGYLESGGRILTGYWPAANLPEKWLTDRRSDTMVLEEGFTGSRYRDAGLDPSEIFKRPKLRQLSGNIEYGVDVGLRHGLADTDAIQAIEDDGAPISDTREPGETPFLPDDGTVPNHED